MNKYSYGLKFGSILAFISVVATNFLLYLLGMGVFLLTPLFIVAVFAALFGSILGLAKAEDSLV